MAAARFVVVVVVVVNGWRGNGVVEVGSDCSGY